ncbi:hypothetical protein K437DRAFT_253128 [Tilletiaria anomala UBC 951]|uniref:TAP42-like protein n=1 Tax=Tilletiaria anomala (strain ATCC 24038 / CBS 436.72 / UBC 951) TaxID=1037660 RepID=A0A066WRZ1_TILAU|nr:uncharacterized protein K437DRAFT_253128 [Tilletiaria anomala UBC 951]KDN53430.1 hypothetical protein K437DRAFT_253128 [Tilletiaria anomala UBC 951]
MEGTADLTFNQLLQRCFALAAGDTGAGSFVAASAAGMRSSTAQDPALPLVSLLELAARRAAQLALVNPAEETLREVSTGALRSLLIHSLRGEAEANVRTAFDARAERRRRLANSKAHYNVFLHSLQALKIIPPITDSLLKAHAQLYASDDGEDGGEASSASRTALPPNAALAASARRRELKIALFKTERSLKSSLELFRSAFSTSNRLWSGSAALSSPEDVFYDAMFPRRPRRKGGEGGEETNSDGDQEEADSDDDDEDKDDEEEDRSADGQVVAGASSDSNTGVPRTVRAYILLLLNLHAVKASQQLESAQQELQLLASMPEAAAVSENGSGLSGADLRQRARHAGNPDWRLDRGPGGSGALSGPLLDDKGKPLRPFVITDGTDNTGSGAAEAAVPAEMSARERAHAEVFRPSHRLPTMSIDDYLAEERRRGNIIEGGGAAAAAQPTPREARALRAEGHGPGGATTSTTQAEEADEERRREQIEWDEFKEANPKGAGNTMNRG